MRILLQRVREASVTVGNEVVSRIGRGYLLFVGVGEGDGPAESNWLAAKVAGLRIFEDSEGKLNRSLKDIGGEALVVSQFTLYADACKGRRPSFSAAATPDKAEPLCAEFAEMLRKEGVPVREGVFGAKMKVALVNDGPVTILLEKEPAS